MKIVLFGASGMIGQGVLRECLSDPEVTAVVSVGRRATGAAHPKLREVVHGDLADLTAIEHEFDGVDACFDCLGVSSAGMREADYRRITYDYALAAGRTLVKHSPTAVLVFVSGAGTDSTGQGRSMWARVKGQTENTLLGLPFANVGESAETGDARKTGGAFMFRPAYIHAMHGIVSRTRLYRTLYVFTRPLFPVLKWLLPSHVTTTENIGKAMLAVARRGAPKRVLESPDIERLATP